MRIFGGHIETLSSIPPEEKKEMMRKLLVAVSEQYKGMNLPKAIRVSQEDLEKEYFSSSLSKIYFNEKRQLVGYILAKYDRSDLEKKTIEIKKFGVNPNYRRMGIGKSLMLALAIEAKDLLIDRVHLLVFKENRTAQQAYLTYGFRIDPERCATIGANSLGVIMSAKSEFLFETLQNY